MMTRTMPNGKTFLQNLDGMLTFQANMVLFKFCIKFFIVAFFLGSPLWSFMTLCMGEYLNHAEKFESIKIEFLDINSRRENMDYLDYCQKIYELDEKRENMINAEKGEDYDPYGVWYWLSLIPGLIFMYFYYHMGRHYWRTPFRIIYLPYLLINGAFLMRFMNSFGGEDFSNSIYAFFAYNYTPGYYFWHVVNIVMFFFYIVFYFMFMFGRPEPESRWTRAKQKFFEGENPLPDLLW